MEDDYNPLLERCFGVSAINGIFLLRDGDLTVNGMHLLITLWKEKNFLYKDTSVLVAGSFEELFSRLIHMEYILLLKQPVFFVCWDQNEEPGHCLSGYSLYCADTHKINIYIFDSLLNTAHGYTSCSIIGDLMMKNSPDWLCLSQDSRDKILKFVNNTNFFVSCLINNYKHCKLQKTDSGCSFFALKTLFKLIRSYHTIHKYISCNKGENFFVLPLALTYLSQDISIIHGLIMELQEEPIYLSGLRRYPLAVRENKLLSPLAREKYNSEVRAHPRRNHTMLYFALKYYDTIYCVTQASILRGPSYYEEEELAAPPAAALGH